MAGKERCGWRQQGIATSGKQRACGWAAVAPAQPLQPSDPFSSVMRPHGTRPGRVGGSHSLGRQLSHSAALEAW